MSEYPNHNGASSGGIVIIGAGAWGTTLGALFAPLRPTRLWCRRTEQAAELSRSRENARYLPGIRLPDQLEIEPFGVSPLAQNDLIMVAVPSHQVRTLSESLQLLWNGQIIVNSAKGFEHRSMKTLSLVIEEMIPGAQVVVWSGPNIARELAEGKPTRAVLAGRDMSVLSRVVKTLRNDRVTFEISRDVRGVELCASLKGILAVTIGLADGLDLGDNFTGLLLTYGLREFAAVAGFMGIPHDTIYGIAGLGDCVTSSLSPHGRNRTFGRLISRGIAPQDAMRRVGMVVEGVQMLQTIAEFEDLNVPTPIFSAVKRIVFYPNGHIRDLMVDTVMNYNVPRSRQASTENTGAGIVLNPGILI